jgi:outer membrane receptor for ferrienterochelin and colicin
MFSTLPASSFRRKPLNASILAAFLLMSSSAAYGQNDNRVEALQRQVETLQKELEESRRALEAARGDEVVGSPPVLSGEASQAGEQQQLEAVVVRSRKIQPLETLKEVPTSVSVVSGEELDRLGATDITQTLNRIGNVNFNYGNPRTGSLTLRGITTAIATDDQVDPTIGTMLDGVSLSFTPLVNGYPFVDIDTVSVTRGPTGTQGGKISNIGRITFTTKSPTFFPEAEIKVTLGEWDTLKSTAVLGGPIVDGLLAWRGTILREQGDGPWQTHFPDLKGRASYKNVDRTFGRVQFLLTPSDNFKAKLSVEHQPKGHEWINGLSIRHPEPTHYTDGTPRNPANINSAYQRYRRDWFNKDPVVYNAERDYYLYPVNADNNGAIVTGSKGVTLNLDWKVAGHTLESITGWRSHWFSAANDEGTPYDVTKGGGFISSYSQKSQEFRLISDKGGFVDYLAGLFWFSSDDDALSRTLWGNDAGAYQANNAQYALLNANGIGQALLRDSLNLAYRGTDTFVKNEGVSIYGEAEWHLSEPLTLMTGARVSHEKRRTAKEYVLYDPGIGSELSNAFGLTTNTATVVDAAAANRLAAYYFGAGNTYSTLSSANQALLQNAAAVRNGALSQAALFSRKDAKPWEGQVYAGNVSLTDKINDNLTVYSSLQYAEKPGVAQIDAQGRTSIVDKERTTGLEFGLRSSLLNKTLTLNAGVFVNDLKNFQTTVSVLDPDQTAANISSGLYSGNEALAYQSLVGNVPKVRIKGVEIDAFYTGIQNLTLRVAAAYNDARYADDFYLQHPSEVRTGAGTGLSTHYNAKGDTLSNAPKFTATLGVDYNLPVLGTLLFHTSANYKWQSTAYYSSSGVSALSSDSRYNKQKSYGLLDLGIGIGKRDGSFDTNLIIRNALDTDYHVEGWSGYTPSTPRWIGVAFTGRF